MGGRDGGRGRGWSGGRGRHGGRKVLNKNFMKSSDSQTAGQQGGDGDSGAKAELERANAERDMWEAEVGFELFTDGDDRLGWLMNMSSVGNPGREHPPIPFRSACQDGSPALPRGNCFATRRAKCCASGTLFGLTSDAVTPQTSLEDKDSGQIVSAVACYFMCQVGLLPFRLAGP